VLFVESAVPAALCAPVWLLAALPQEVISSAQAAISVRILFFMV
jgi:hypothetical protein